MEKVVYDLNRVISETTGTDVLSLADAKSFLRVDSNDEDSLITSLIDVACHAVQMYTGHIFPYIENLDVRLESLRDVQLPIAPIIKVGPVSYFDQGNNQVTLDSDAYWSEPISTRSNRLRFKGALPSVYLYRSHPVQCVVECGYEETEGIPPMMIHAVRLLVSQYYDQRENFIVGTIVSKELPNGIKALLSPFRNVYFV